MSCGCCLRSLQRCKCLNPCMPTWGASTDVPTPAHLQLHLAPGTCHDRSVLVTYPEIRVWSGHSGCGRAIPSTSYHLRAVIHLFPPRFPTPRRDQHEKLTQCVGVQGFTQEMGRNQRLLAAQRLPVPPAPGNPVQHVLIGTIRKAFPKAPLHTWARSDVGWDTLAFRGRLQGGFNLMLALTLGRISQVGGNS